MYTLCSLFAIRSFLHTPAISPWRCWDARYSCAYGNATGHFARFLALPVPWVLAVSSGTFLVASAISGLFERYVAAAVLLVIAVVGACVAGFRASLGKEWQDYICGGTGISEINCNCREQRGHYRYGEILAAQLYNASAFRSAWDIRRLALPLMHIRPGWSGARP